MFNIEKHYRNKIIIIIIIIIIIKSLNYWKNSTSNRTIVKFSKLMKERE